MREQLVNIIKARVNSELDVRNPVKKLLDRVDIAQAVDIAISVVYLYTRMKKGSNKTVYMAEIISAIGHQIISKNKMKRDSSVAAKTGTFFLYTFDQLEYLEVMLGQGKGGHAAYIVKVLNDEAITGLWEELPKTGVEKLPALTPYAPWTSVRHSTGALMIKTGNQYVNSIVQPETHPILFSVLNKAQSIGWRVNNEILAVQKWALKNKTEAYNDIWSQRSPEAKATKLREARAVISMAERFSQDVFYHLYYYDFRGRRYPTTAYLHEQSTDPAKGLLLFDKSKRLGSAGFRWLLISIASNWGGDSGRDDGLKTDKIPLAERVAWAEDNLEILLSYAQSPKLNTGWMNADKPWQFLSMCFELMHAFECENPYDYCSSIVVYIDGSNNGSQHLAALVRDESTAPHVNLVPLALPGDLYLYVSDHVWNVIDKVLEGYTKTELKAINRYIDTLIDLKKQMMSAEPASDRRKELVKCIEECRKEHEDVVDKAASVFWSRIKVAKERRKTVKRNVMTLPYGGTAYGLGEQQIDDAKKHGIELLLYMEHKWGSFMGRLVLDTCKEHMVKPMRLLSVFEKAGAAADEAGEFLSWTVPITNFPVVQNYTQGVMHKLRVQFGPPSGPRNSSGYYDNTLQLHIAFIEEVVPSKGRQKSGASPNAIHSLDAGHLSLTVHEADYDMATVHDSFGCSPTDMDNLFVLVRKTFVDMYKTDPLVGLMTEMKGDASNIEYGNLDIESIMQSEYAFV